MGNKLETKYSCTRGEVVLTAEQFTLVRPAVQRRGGSDVSVSGRDHQAEYVTHQVQDQLLLRDFHLVSRSPARRSKSRSVAVVRDARSSSAVDSGRRRRAVSFSRTTAAVGRPRRSATPMKDCETGLVTRCKMAAERPRDCRHRRRHR